MVVVMDSSVSGSRGARLRPVWRKGMTMTIGPVSTITLLVCKRLTPLVTIRHEPADALQAQGEALLNRDRRLHTVTRIPIPQPEPQWQPAIATHAQAQEHLFQIATPIFTMPIGRPGRSRGLRFVLIRPIEHNGGGVLMQPGRWDRIDLQGFEGDRAKHPVEIGGKQRIEDVPQAVIMECGPC